nr:MAG TPA: hypothetical protein [Bacteriophage sp.]
MFLSSFFIISMVILLKGVISIFPTQILFQNSCGSFFSSHFQLS